MGRDGTLLDSSPSPRGPNHARAHLLFIPVLVQSLFVLICVLLLLWNLFLVHLVILSSTFEACDSAPRGSPYIRVIFEEVIFFWDISFSSLEQDFFFFFPLLFGLIGFSSLEALILTRF